MKSVIHRADSRGHQNRGWVDSRYTFVYGEYFDPERLHFGVLGILNEDIVTPGLHGFGPHLRNNMEIVSIPLEGELEHRDSLGNHQILRPGRIQVMSAGSGLRVSEYNASTDHPLHFLHIWLLADRRDVQPRYMVVDLAEILVPNTLTEIIRPAPGDGRTGWVNQQAWFSMGKLDAETEVTYTLKSPGSYGVYLFVISGEVAVDDAIELMPRDGMGISQTDSFRLRALTPAELLLIEVPPLKKGQ